MNATPPRGHSAKLPDAHKNNELATMAQQRRFSLCLVVDKVKAASASSGGRWRHEPARLHPNPPERHPTSSPSNDAGVTSSQNSSPRDLTTVSPSFAVTGKSLASPVQSRQFVNSAKYFKLYSNLVKTRKTSVVSVHKAPVKRKKARQSVSIRVVSKLKKKKRDRAPAKPKVWRPSVERRLMLRKKVFPVHQKVICDPRQFVRSVREDSDVQKTVNNVLKSKVMLIGTDANFSNLKSANNNVEEEVTVDYLQNTYDFFHQRHVDNLKNMIAEQQDDFCQQPERKKIHIHEDFYCEPDFLMETEERPLSGSSDGSNNSRDEDIDRLSENIDKCQIREPSQKVKPKITFTHVSGPDFKSSARGASEKNSKVSSPLLEVPSLFLDLSSEMLRPPLGNM